MTMVIDFFFFSAVDVYLTLVKVCEMRYPETLKYVAVINGEYTCYLGEK